MHMKSANKCQAGQNDVALGALAPSIQIKFSVGATGPLALAQRYQCLQLHNLKGSKSESFRSTEDRLVGKDVERLFVSNTALQNHHYLEDISL